MPQSKGFARHALIYIGSAGLNAFVPFLVLPWLARWLGPDGFGTMGTFMAMVNIAAVLAGLSVHGRISVSYFKEGPQTLPPQVGACFGVLAITALPLLAGLLVAGRQIAEVTTVATPWLWCVWLAACGQFVVMVSLAVWQVRRSPLRYALTQVGFTLAWAALSLMLIGFADLGWPGRAAGQAAAAGGTALVCVVYLTRLNLVDWNPKRWPMKSALQFGLPLLPHSLAAVTMTSVDRFTLTGMVGANSAGHYFAAFQIAALLSVTAAAVNQAWVPWMYRRLADGGQTASRSVVRVTYVLYGILLGASMVMAVFSDELVRLLVGPAFAPAAPLLALLAPAAALAGMYYFVTGYLFYAGRTGTLSAITLLCATSQIVLTVVLVRNDGSRGAALAALASMLLYWAATALVANRVRPMPWLASLARERS